MDDGDHINAKNYNNLFFINYWEKTNSFKHDHIKSNLRQLTLFNVEFKILKNFENKILAKKKQISFSNLVSFPK